MTKYGAQQGDLRELFSLLRRLWVHVTQRRRLQLLALGALVLVGSAAELVSLGMVLPFLGALAAPERILAHAWSQPLVDALDLESSRQLILALTVLFGAAAALSGAARLALLWVQTRLGHAIGADLGAGAFRRTLYQSYAVHVERNSSEIVSALMTKINTTVYFVVIPLLTLAASLLIVLSIVVFMFMVDPMLTLLSFGGFGLLYVVVGYASRRRLLRDSQLVTIGQTQVTQVVQEGLGGIRDVLIDGLQETYSRIFGAADARLRRALANINIIAGAPRPIIEAFGLVLIAWLAYLISGRTSGVAGAIPALGALALATQRLLPLVQQAFAGWTSVLGGLGSLRDVLLLLEQPVPAHGEMTAPVPMRFAREICLREVRFRYESQASEVLGGIDLTIRRGSRVGFIGTTGGGKTTLLDILMALLTPTSGALLVDDVSIDVSNQRAWQVHIAHVPQSIFLADASVAENIAFGVPAKSIDLARVRQAARKAQIADTIESWNDNYWTRIGERGVRLSGGQRQRIGIARALYKQADVIVFDEATSALDDDTEQAVVDAIDSLDADMTMLIVAHRLSTLRNCDQIVELSGGRVQRLGTYSEIVERPAHARRSS